MFERYNLRLPALLGLPEVVAFYRFLIANRIKGNIIAIHVSISNIVIGGFAIGSEKLWDVDISLEIVSAVESDFTEWDAAASERVVILEATNVTRRRGGSRYSISIWGVSIFKLVCTTTESFILCSSATLSVDLLSRWVECCLLWQEVAAAVVRANNISGMDCFFIGWNIRLWR